MNRRRMLRRPGKRTAERMPAVTAVRYLTGIIEKQGITDEEQAQQMISGLEETIGVQ